MEEDVKTSPRRENGHNMTQIDLETNVPAVAVRNAYKSYSGHHVLKGLNLTIPQRSIFALLGPSGCGKTTLLNIIIGQLTLDNGYVETSNRKVEKIGYMPQDLSLYQEFTIIEILNYYGMLYGMTFEEIENRATELLTFLMLPPKERFINTLSGGQQRRVSLCLSLVHNPDLIVLDEPTVGVDPVLSASIWEKLIYMTKTENKTIIITTHYIEEAKQADTVGLMRDGVLLAEGNPLKIMASENCETLEEAFLKLSKQQSLAITNNNNHTKSLSREPSSQSIIPQKRKLSARINVNHLDDTSLFKSYRVYAQLMKQYYWMKRNMLVVLFIMMLPVIQCSLQYYAFGGDPKGIQISVVNDEASNCSLIPTNFTGCNTKFLSCAFVDYLSKKNVKLIPKNDFNESIAAVTNTMHTWASLYFPKNFSRDFLDRVISGRWAEMESLEHGEITLFTDNSDYLVGLLTKKKVIEAYIEFTRDLYTECEWPVRLSEIPISFQDPIFGDARPNFADASIAPTVIIVAFFLPLMYTGISILSERLCGQWERTMVSGTSMLEIMTAHCVIQAFMWSIQTMAMIYLEYYFFKSPLRGSMFLAVMLLILNGLGGTFLGATLAFAGNNFTEVSSLVLGIYFMTLFLGGTTWPVQGMHKSLKAIYYVIPLALPSEALRAISYKSWDITHPVIYMGFISAGAYVIIFITTTFLVVKLQKLGFKINLSVISL